MNVWFVNSLDWREKAEKCEILRGLEWRGMQFHISQRRSKQIKTCSLCSRYLPWRDASLSVRVVLSLLNSFFPLSSLSLSPLVCVAYLVPLLFLLLQIDITDAVTHQPRPQPQLLSPNPSLSPSLSHSPTLLAPASAQPLSPKLGLPSCSPGQQYWWW